MVLSQVDFNYSLEEREIEAGLRAFYDVVEDLNNGDLAFNDRSLKRRMTSIIGLGDLDMHHVLHLSAMVGLIQNTDILAYANIAKGTTTWTSIRAYYHLGEAVLNRMISDIATELHVSQLVVENALCELSNGHVFLVFDGVVRCFHLFHLVFVEFLCRFCFDSSQIAYPFFALSELDAVFIILFLTN